jgi:hypothetical protein
MTVPGFGTVAPGVVYTANITRTFANSNTWTVPAGTSNVQYMIVAGGGGGGWFGGGGGGAGGFRLGYLAPTEIQINDTFNVIIGAGGGQNQTFGRREVALVVYFRLRVCPVHLEVVEAHQILV